MMKVNLYRLIQKYVCIGWLFGELVAISMYGLDFKVVCFSVVALVSILLVLELFKNKLDNL